MSTSFLFDFSSTHFHSVLLAPPNKIFMLNIVGLRGLFNRAACRDISLHSFGRTLSYVGYDDAAALLAEILPVIFAVP